MRWIGIAVVPALFFSRLAHAATSDDVALAEELFRQAKLAMEERRWDDACPKLAESFRLDPGGGTMLTLALCHESQGKTAAAWAEFGEALTFARRDNRPNREEIAREHIDALRPKLVRLRLVVDPATTKLHGLVIKRDGIELMPAAWDVSAPVDPGKHLVEATAPGYASFVLDAEVVGEGATVDVRVPALAPSKPETAPTLSAPLRAPETDRTSAPRPPSALRIGSYAVGGVGLALLGAGTYFTLSARSDQDEANRICPRVTCADPSAVEASRSAGRSADLATGFFIGGAVALGAAAVLWIISSR